MNFEVTSTPDAAVDELVFNHIRAYNSKFLPSNSSSLSVYCHDNSAVLIGGLTGRTFWDYLDIGFLWVDEKNRGKGIASHIIGLAEEEAKHRGCYYSVVDTYEFQALSFYEKQGYRQFGKLEGYCNKYERYYLTKKL